jgi:uncharacterized membrane protein
METVQGLVKAIVGAYIVSIVGDLLGADVLHLDGKNR